MRPHIKTTLKGAWNILLISFACFVSLILLRRIAPQFSLSETAGMVAAGIEGVGVLLCLLVACASFVSPLWFRCPPWVRSCFGLLLACMLVGAYFVNRTLQHELGPVIYWTPIGEYTAFFGTYLAFTLPHLLFGCGYPGLLLRFFKRHPNSHNAS